MIYVLAAILPLAVLIFLLIGGFKRIGRKMCGWDNLLQQFPARPIQPIGEPFSAGGHSWGARWLQYNSPRFRGFQIQFAREGLHATPNFAKNEPILIPWLAVKEVVEFDEGAFSSEIIVTIECPEVLQFYLPLTADPIFREHLPPETIRKQTLAGAISDRLHGR